MKKVSILIIALLLIVMGMLSGCEDKNEYTIDPERTNAYDEPEEVTEFGSIAEYMRHYERVEGTIVTVPGLLGDECITELFAGDSLNIDASGVEGFDKIHKNAKVYATGESCIDSNGNPYIKLSKAEYYERLSEPYWSNSTLVTDENVLDIFSSDVDPSEYFEFTAVIDDDLSDFQLIGLNDAIVLSTLSSSYYGANESSDAFQVLVTNITVTDAGIDFEIVESYDLEKEQ